MILAMSKKIDVAQVRNFLQQGADILGRFDPQYIVDNLVHFYALAGDSSSNVTRGIENILRETLYLGLTKTASRAGLWNNTADCEWSEILKRVGENTASSAKTGNSIPNLTSFIIEFFPLYEANRNLAPAIGRHYIDMSLDNLFFYARHFEVVHVDKPSPQFKISEQDKDRLSRLYDRFTNLIGDASRAAPSGPLPERVSDLIGFVDAYISNNAYFLDYQSSSPGNIGPGDRRSRLGDLQRIMQEVRQIETGAVSPPSSSAHPGPVDTTTFIAGLQHYLAHHSGKIPENLRNAVSASVLMLQEQQNVIALDQNYQHLNDRERQYTLPFHASLWGMPRPERNARQPENIVLRVATYVALFRTTATAAMEEHAGVRRKRESWRGRLERFEDAMRRVPDSMELTVVPYTKRPSSETGNLRGTFNDQVKKDFIRKTAIFHGLSLLKAGLGVRQIFSMITTGIVPHSDDKESRLTVEHINDLASGGYNDTNQMCLMSSRLNRLKDIFVTAQTDDMKPGETRYVVSFVPKKQNIRRFSLKKTVSYPLIVSDAGLDAPVAEAA